MICIYHSWSIIGENNNILDLDSQVKNILKVFFL